MLWRIVNGFILPLAVFAVRFGHIFFRFLFLDAFFLSPISMAVLGDK
jgi:hypothetical protein